MATEDEPKRDHADDKLAEKLTERIRSGTVPPPLRSAAGGAEVNAKSGERPARSSAAGGAEVNAKSGERPARSSAAGGAEVNAKSGERPARSSAAEVNDTLTESIRARLEHLVPELVKKTFAAGMGAVFQTEEGIRRLARESLPDVVGYAASATSDAKDKVWEIVALQTREFLSNLNLTEEIAKILTTLSFEIKTEVRFIPNSERLIGSEPDVKASVRLKRNEPRSDKPDNGRSGE